MWPAVSAKNKNAKQTQRAGLFRGTTLFTRLIGPLRALRGAPRTATEFTLPPQKRPSHSAYPGSLSAASRPLLGCASATPLPHWQISYSRIISIQNRNNRIILTILLWLYALFVFVYWVSVVDSGIFPYTSEILGIVEQDAF